MDAYKSIFISRIKGLKTSERLFLSDLFSVPEEFTSIRKNELEQAVGRVFHKDPFNPDFLRAETDRIVDGLERKNIRVLSFWDSLYPPQLREIYDPPFLLYARGTVMKQDLPMAAVVGTRKPTGSGRRAAFQLGMELAERGFPVVSGLASGIDSEVHKGVLEGHGKTIAVLGNGIDSFYPPENYGLGEKILGSGGAVLSEYAPGTGPRRYYFPARNRIISGLSRAVVVVEGREKSGAMITADFALEQGRDLFVHRVGMESPEGEGLRRLEAEGAPVIEKAEDFTAGWPAGEYCRDRTYRIREDGFSEIMESEIEGYAAEYGEAV